MPDVEPKKVFISYSWKNKQKVKEIVDELISNGIETIFDVYDLKPGDDLHYFMERSVNDPSVDFVLIFSDQIYADKANKRDAGVGTETLIIASEVYDSKDNSKFIPISLEKDDSGIAFMPAYLKSRYYIDLSSDDKYEEEFEKLIRYIFDVPSDRKPALGKPPAYLSDSKYDLSPIRNCIRAARSSIHPMLIPDMINSTTDAYQRIFIDTKQDLDSFYDSLKQSLEVRDLIIDFTSELIKHKEKPEDFIVRMMESIGDLRVQFPSQIHNDLVSFIQWELFLSFVSVYIYVEDYEGLNSLLHRTYYMYDWFDRRSKNSYDYQHLQSECLSLSLSR
ncbi:MAG: toll/interleukin-1 receptor domain-containing protein [Gudongella sp.]|nr:toll/interleukin-1 receptor domain-containing protein [Gudongella sp.]